MEERMPQRQISYYKGVLFPLFFFFFLFGFLIASHQLYHISKILAPRDSYRIDSYTPFLCGAVILLMVSPPAGLRQLRSLDMIKAITMEIWSLTCHILGRPNKWRRKVFFLGLHMDHLAYKSQP